MPDMKDFYSKELLETFEKVREMSDYKPHIVSEVICIKCFKRWIAVRPEATKLRDLECENCGAGYVIESGERIIDD